ncbi:TetR/AcrR family transcriptional regulator [Rhodococcus sp. NPDC057297]|uniref:TetR/AcrR family transcriptional regulator n=1 Tax=Rhodococcus sp. NPDC057297 TaxID=3346090 RepID=UPI00362FEB28
MTSTNWQNQPTAPYRRPGSDRLQRTLERTRILHVCADAIVTRGYGAVTMNMVQHESGLARDQLYRLFPNKNELLAEVYRRGHHHAGALCRPASSTTASHTSAPRTTSPKTTSPSTTLRDLDSSTGLGAGAGVPIGAGLDRVRAFAHAAIESAVSNPLVQAMHALEVSPVAAATGLPSIYQVWEHWLAHALVAALQADAVPSAGTGTGTGTGTGDAWMTQGSDMAGVVVDALAGIIAATRRDGQDSNGKAARSIDLVMRSMESGLRPLHVPHERRGFVTAPRV